MGRAVVPIPYHSNANVTAKALVVLGTGPGSASKSPKAWVKMLCVSECDCSALASSPAGRSRMPQALLSLLSAVSATLVEPMVTLPYQAWHCSAEFSHKCGAVAATYCARLAWMAGMPGTTCPDDMSFGRIGCISSRRRHPFPGRPRRPCYERLNNRKLPEQKQLQHLLAHNCWRIKQQLHLIAKQCGTSFYRRFMSKSKAALTAVSADYSLPAVSATGKTLRAMDR